MEADPSRLRQVVVNLLNNACKYTDAGGRIRVAVERAEAEAVVRVEDTGIGLAPEMLGRVFDLYAQAADGRRHAQGGLGIGLSLVKCLVELHGGSVSARSDGPGRGSTFVVRLPVGEATPCLEAPGPKSAPGRARPLRVLLVDDNRDSTRSLAQLLRLWGHDVETAADGASALWVAGTFRPEVVLLDVGLPGIDGREVGRRLRRVIGLEPALLVALTGFGAEEDHRLSREAGLDYHLVKPVDTDALRDLLARHAAGADRDQARTTSFQGNGGE
jgi:two-component system CheB/CheR fusion protein